MSLNTSEWKFFSLDKLFKIEAGIYHYKDEYNDGNTPYCSCTAENNGIVSKIDLSPDFTGNKIIISKINASTFYETEPFCATSDVNILTPNFKMSPLCALFITTVINKNENFRWCYGRQCRIGNTKRIKIRLPIKKDVIDESNKFSSEGFVPDWEWMENYIKSLKYKQISTNVRKNNSFILDTTNWKSFLFKDLLSNQGIYKAKAYSKVELNTFDTYKQGRIPFVSRTELNNSVDCYARESDFPTYEEGNAISIGDTTSTIAYQPEPFINGDHIVVIRAPWLNKYTGLFITTLLRKERFRYSYGKAFLVSSINNTILKLPAIPNGSPDWEFMENYIKSLPYGDRI